jgi:hypothetical protein
MSFFSTVALLIVLISCLLFFVIFGQRNFRTLILHWNSYLHFYLTLREMSEFMLNFPIKAALFINSLLPFDT